MFDKTMSAPFELNFLNTNTNVLEDTITINGVKYKKVEDTKMTTDAVSSSRTVTYKGKIYFRIEPSAYLSVVEWWEKTSLYCMIRVQDKNLETELNREYTNQHQTIKVPDYFNYNLGGGGTYSGSSTFYNDTINFKTL